MLKAPQGALSVWRVGMQIPFNPELAQRHTRSPKHNFNVAHQMWEIQPFLIAPVCPGETLAGLTLQSRCVTPPLKSRTVGWWLEYYIFYVPFRQMPDAANLVAMFVDPTTTLSATSAAAHRYYNAKGYDYVSQCLQVVTQEWFRREGESWSSFTIRANRPAASVGLDHFSESILDSTVLPDGGAVSGVTNVDDMIRAQAVTEYRRQLALMGGDGGEVDYEEVLASYGASLRIAKQRERPELIRYIREWTYPTNTVEPTTGTPTTAASWAVTDRADKNRRFQEPGFIFGVSVVRPKIYYSRQDSAGASILDRARAWLPPAYEGPRLEVGLREFANNGGPFTTTTNGYWIDIRDLFNHGDQYIDAIEDELNGVAMPTAGLNHRYGTEAMAEALLFYGEEETPTDQQILTTQDGNVQLRVRTRAVEAS